MSTSPKKTNKDTKPKKRKKPNKPLRADAVKGMHKPEEFRQYGLFMALPSEERKAVFGYATDKAFGKAMKVNVGTLSEWKMKPELWEIRDEYLIVFKKHTTEILASLAKRSKKSGEAFHVLTWMKIVEGFTEKSGIDLTSKGRRVSGFNVTVRHAKNEPKSSRDPGPKGKQ